MVNQKQGLLLGTFLGAVLLVACGGDDPSNGGSDGGSGGSGDGGSSGNTSAGGSGGSAGSGDVGGSGGGGSDSGGSDSGGSDSGGSDSGGSGGLGGTGGAGGTSTNTSSAGGTGNGGSSATGGGTSTGGAGGTGAGGTGAGGTGGGEVVVELDIVVSPAADRREISPLIYGVTGAALGASSGAKLVRVGGEPSNIASGYNWEVNATHQGVDCSEGPGGENLPFGSGSEPGAVVSEVLAVAEANQGAGMFVIPIGPRVAADATEGDVTSSEDYLTTRFRQNLATKPVAFDTTPDLTDDYVYQDEFVNWLMNQAPSAPAVFALDKHPELWDAEVCLLHSEKATYDDVVNLGVEFALALKAVWPDAEVTGPASYGWQGFVDLQGSPDVTTKGEFLDYYLARMQEAEDDENMRLLDYLDIHWWPEVYAEGQRIIDESNEPAVVAARLQAPRSLWDATYDEQSWLSAALGPLNLISRMETKIDDNYPGTKLAFGSWYYGGAEHISGALAAADVLGIFGREGVQLASVAAPEDAPFVSAAFQAFLNYDGAGAHFGDTSVGASSSDLEGSSVYASVESGSESDLVIVLINKRGNERETTVTIEGDAEYDSVRVYELTDSGAELVAGDTLPFGEDRTFEYQMPAYSLAVLVPELSE